jgi:hypothetical protein
VIYLSHFLSWMVWAPIVLMRLRLRGLLVVLPSAPLFLIQGDRPDGGSLQISARWLVNEPKNFPDLLFEYVSVPEKVILVGGLVVALVLAWRLMDRDPERDRRPLFLFAFLTVLFFTLPFALYKPFYWSNINVRLPPLAFLILCACVPRGRLEGRRALYVAAPIVAVLVMCVAVLVPRFLAFERRSRDFYAVAADLPRNPDVFVHITDTQDPMRRNLWKEQGAYIGVDKGGLRYFGWLRNFPIRVRDGKKHLLRDTEHRPQAYRFVITRDTKGKKRKLDGFTVKKQQGEWTLWERNAPATPARR